MGEGEGMLKGRVGEFVGVGCWLKMGMIVVCVNELWCCVRVTRSCLRKR